MWYWCNNCILLALSKLFYWFYNLYSVVENTRKIVGYGPCWRGPVSKRQRLDGPCWWLMETGLYPHPGANANNPLLFKAAFMTAGQSGCMRQTSNNFTHAGVRCWCGSRCGAALSFTIMLQWLQWVGWLYYAILERVFIMRGMLCLAIGSIQTLCCFRDYNIGISAVTRSIHWCFYRHRCSRCPNQPNSSIYLL